MSVLLFRNYGAYQAGSIVSLPASTEAAIVAQGLGSVSVANPTAGNIASNEHQGRAAIAAGAGQVVVTNPNVNVNSKVQANIALGTADGTLTYVTRILAANGSFTVYGNANATGVVPIDWQITSTGLVPNN